MELKRQDSGDTGKVLGCVMGMGGPTDAVAER